MDNEERNLWRFIDNYDEKGVPAGIIPVGSIPNIDKSRMSDEQKVKLARVCAKAKTGYYLDLERYKKSTDPSERARLAAIMAEKEARTERMFAEEMNDGL